MSFRVLLNGLSWWNRLPIRAEDLTVRAHDYMVYALRGVRTRGVALIYSHSVALRVVGIEPPFSFLLPVGPPGTPFVRDFIDCLLWREGGGRLLRRVALSAVIPVGGYVDAHCGDGGEGGVDAVGGEVGDGGEGAGGGSGCDDGAEDDQEPADGDGVLDDSGGGGDDSAVTTMPPPAAAGAARPAEATTAKATIPAVMTTAAAISPVLRRVRR